MKVNNSQISKTSLYNNPLLKIGTHNKKLVRPKSSIRPLLEMTVPPPIEMKPHRIKSTKHKLKIKRPFSAKPKHEEKSHIDIIQDFSSEEHTTDIQMFGTMETPKDVTEVTISLP